MRCLVRRSVTSLVRWRAEVGVVGRIGRMWVRCGEWLLDQWLLIMAFRGLVFLG